MGNCYLKTFSSPFSLKTNDCHLGGLLLYLFCAMNLWCSICESSSCSSFLVRSASSVTGAEYTNFQSNNWDKCTISLPSPPLYFFCIVDQAHNFPRFAPADICQSFSHAKSHGHVQRSRKFYLFYIYKHKFRWPDILHKRNSGKTVVVSKLCLRIEKELGKSTSNSSVQNECRTKLNTGNNMHSC